MTVGEAFSIGKGSHINSEGRGKLCSVCYQVVERAIRLKDQKHLSSASSSCKYLKKHNGSNRLIFL